MRTFSKTIVAALLMTTAAGITGTTASANFTDSGHIAPWAYDAVLQASHTGIMQGGTDNQFRPLDAITRQEAAAILVKLLKLDVTASTAITFTDVNTKDWGWKEIEAVKKAGVMLGDGAVFRPQDKITREELAVILVKAAGNDTAGKGDALTVADHGRISAWAKAYVQIALEQNLMSGDGTNFNPQSHATRQEVAVMAANYTTYVLPAPTPGEEDPTTPSPDPGGGIMPAELVELNHLIRINPSAMQGSNLREEGFQHVSDIDSALDAYRTSLQAEQTTANRDLTREEIQQILDTVNVMVLFEVTAANDGAGLVMALETAGITGAKAALADLYMQKIAFLPQPQSLASIQAAVTTINTANAALSTALTNVDAALDAEDSAALLTALQAVATLPALHAEHADAYLSELSMEREFNHGEPLTTETLARVIEMVNISLSGK